MKLSENFNLSEFTKSNTAKRNNIVSQYNPPSFVIANLKDLTKYLLQPLRNGIGHNLTVSSGYRSKKVNELIGGAESSQHSKGQAADLKNTKGSNIDIVREVLAQNLPFDQMIIEFGTFLRPSWIHLSYSKGNNRYMILRATRGANGRTNYKRLNNNTVAKSLGVKIGEKKMLRKTNLGKTTGIIVLAVPFLIAAYFKLRNKS